MSRNLGDSACYYCEGIPVLSESPRPITRDEAGPYFEEFRTMQVAEAECPHCEAKYLAWVDPPTQGLHAGWPLDRAEGATHYDLSFRSTFDDEPGPEDKPTYAVEKRVTVEWIRRGAFV